MKRAISILLICSAMIMILTSCSSLVKITYKDGEYFDKANAITYFAADVNYEPISVGKEYAKCEETVLYKIVGLEPKEWLTESFEGIGSIYYASTVKLPMLSEFEPSEIYICSVDSIIIQLKTIDVEEDIKAIVDLMSNGEDAELPTDGSNSYHLKFKSDKYTGIYYDILYVIGKNNVRYLFDRSTKKCVIAGDLIEKYMPTANQTAESEEQGE